MKRKTAKVNLVKLSPNEEAHLAREELERRRKLRLQQVREQERYIASQVRREVRERREKELQNLAATLQGEWHEQREDRIQTLEKIYQDSLHAVGQGHRSAKENEPDWEALARRSEEQQERAAQRHREALRELSSRRHIEDEQRNWHVRARKKALEAEKERAAKVASLPPPPPDPAECIVGKAPLTLRKPDVEHFSVTHYSMPETAVDRETHADLPNARQAAEVEAQRLEELEKEEMCDRQGQLEKARLRGNHALKREQQTQDHARWLAELGQLQQADLLRRRQVINTMPAQIFQPLYRRELLREDQQRELEIAFQDLYTGERKVKGDLVLQLVPEPLPALSTDSQDEDLDVTLEPQAPPESEGEPVAPVAPLQVAASRPVGGTGRPALRKLLDRIRTQRDQWIQRDPTAVTTTAESEAVEMVEGMSIETGSLSGEERGPHPVTKQQAPCTPSPTHERSEESIVAGTILPPEERRDEIMAAGTERSEREEALLTQQQEQLALLEELEEKRRSLECRLQEAQQERERLQQAAQVHAETQGPSAPPQEAPLGPAHKAGEPEDPHTQRLRQYQQRLLDQNRLHKKCVEDARHRLEEYQRTLKTRHAAVTLATPQPPSLPPPQHPPVTMGTLHPHASLPVPLCPPDVPPQLSDAFDPSAGARGPAEVSLRAPPKPPCPTPQPLHPEPALPLPTQSLQPPPSQSPQPPAALSLPPKPPPPVPSPTLHSGPETEAPSDRISSSEPVPITLPPERGELPLPPPSVVLELLLSRRCQDQVLSATPHIRPLEPQVRQPPVGRTPSVSSASTQASVEPGALLDGEPQQELPSWATGAERDQEVRQQMRRQRDALQALLTTSSTRSSEVGSEVKQPEKLSLMDTLLRAIEASSELLPPSSAANQRISSIPAPLPQSNESHDRSVALKDGTFSAQHSDPITPLERWDPQCLQGSSMAAPVSRGRVKPPVSRPPARTPLLQEMEPHELSAIQEVDTPANISLSAEFQTPSEPRVDRSENSGSGHSESSSMSLPSLEQLTSSSGVSSKPNGEVKRSESSIGRTSRLSWRDMLRMESEASQPESGSKYPNQQPSDELELDFPSGRRPVDPDCLSSTTISTGSYSTSEHDVNYTVGDSSRLVVESGGRGMASFAGSSPQLSSSSVIGLRSPGATDLALLDSSVQSIIARYTKELDASLRTAGTHTDVSEDVRGGGQGRTSVLQQQDAEQEVPASDSGRSSGKLTPLQDFSTLTQRHSSPTSTRPAEDYGRSADLRISINPADDNSSFETSGHFQPLQPRPDLDSTSSSSSHHSERREQSRRPQERDETIERIIGHLSDQLLSVGRDSTLRQLIGQPSDQSSSLDLEQDRDSNLSRLISQLSRHSSQTSLSGTAAWASASSVSQLIGQLTDQSNSLGADKSSEPNTSQPIGQITDRSVSHCLTEGQDSDMSQMIGLAADLQSSQVLDESRAVTHGPVETTDMQHIQSSVAASDSSRCSEDVGGEGQSALTSSEERAAKVGSPSASTPPGPDPLTFSPQLPLEEGRSEHDDLASGVFHALHPEITHNETAECSMTFHLPPEPRLCSQVEAVHTQEAAESSSDWLESTDSSHPTFGSESSPDRLRTEVSGQSQNPLQLTLERLSILHNSPHDSVQVVSPTRDEPSLAPQPLTSSTHQQDVNPDPVPELPPQESKMDVGAKNQSVSGAKVVLPPWERIMDLGSEKGILDESAISLVSLTETTLQEQDGTLMEGEEGERGKEASGRTQKEGEDDLHEGPKAADDQNLRCQSVMELTSKQSEVEQPALSHAVMLLEFQSSPAVPLQEAFLRRRRDLAQRSVHRVEQLKARWAESRAQSDGTKRMEPKFGQILEPCPDLPGKGSVQKPGTGGASRLKRVGEVKIVTPEQRHLGETEMYQRTERLYSQLEEVKRRKEFLSRQESYAKNREKAKEFQRKTLQKLRGKQTRR